MGSVGIGTGEGDAIDSPVFNCGIVRSAVFIRKRTSNRSNLEVDRSRTKFAWVVQGRPICRSYEHIGKTTG